MSLLNNVRDVLKNSPRDKDGNIEAGAVGSIENPLQNSVSDTTAETILGIRRTENNHFQFVAPYSVEYFSNGHRNKNVIKTRFGAPVGIETFAPAYNDFRSNEYSVYNTINQIQLLFPSAYHYDF